MDWKNLFTAAAAYIAKIRDPNATGLQKLHAFLSLMDLLKQFIPASSLGRVLSDDRVYAMKMDSGYLEAYNQCPCDETKELLGKIGDGAILRKLAELATQALPFILQILPLLPLVLQEQPAQEQMKALSPPAVVPGEPYGGFDNIETAPGGPLPPTPPTPPAVQ